MQGEQPTGEPNVTVSVPVHNVDVEADHSAESPTQASDGFLKRISGSIRDIRNDPRMPRVLFAGTGSGLLLAIGVQALQNGNLGVAAAEGILATTVLLSSLRGK
jgi:hypothetical protein